MSGLMKLLADVPSLLIANPANPSQEKPSISGISAISSVSRPELDHARKRLLALCADELLPASLVDGLSAADIAQCIDASDAASRGYLRSLETSEAIRGGVAPAGWGRATARFCGGCGPVLLWPECPPTVKDCPWCFRRKAGRSIPRPSVTCGSCSNYTPDSINPDAGVGTCNAGLTAMWPMKEWICTTWHPISQAGGK